MSMDSAILDTHALAGAIGVEDVTALIRTLGWTKQPHPNPDVLVYEKGQDDLGKPVKLVLPNGNDFEDAPNMVAVAIRLIAATGGYTPPQVIELLRNRGSDIFRQRLISDSRITSVPLETAPRIVGHLRDLIFYAACAEEDPQPFFDKGRKIGKDYAARCRFGHTFPGSFGLSIEMPIPPNPQASLSPDAEPIPFERRIMERIVRGLHTASRGVREGDVTLITKGFKSGFNANLCEVMANLAEELGGVGGMRTEYSTLWSPEFTVAEDLRRLDPIRIDPGVFRPYFEAAAKSLRESRESLDTIVTGAIVQLRAELDDEDADHDADRQVTIRWEPSPRQMANIRVALGPQEYRLACDAHRDQRSVRVSGRPEKQGKFWVLTSPKDFIILP